MKKSFLVIMLMALATNVFSETARRFINNPKKKEVIVMMTVNLITDFDREFITTTRGVTDTSKDDTYSVYANYELKGYYQVETYDCGTVSNSVVSISSDKEVTIDYVEINMYNHQYLTVFVPLGFKFVVPDDAKAVYLGTFNVYLDGKTFQISDIKRYDEYDSAVKDLKTFYPKKNYDLVRIEDLYVE